MSGYNRYSHHARRALTRAGLLATQYRHPRVDTAHLLVGVLRAQGSIGSTVLAEIGLDPETAEPHLAALTLPLTTPPDAAAVPLPHDAALDLALELAEDESAWLSHHYVGTEHLLLGMTRTNLGNASDLLHTLHISPDYVRRRVQQAVRSGQREFTLQLLRRSARFSELSRRVLNGAEQLAVSLDHETIGIGHLMLALSLEQRGNAARLLIASGLQVERLRIDLETDPARLLQNIEPLLNQALELSRHHSSHYTGTEHLMLALVTEPDAAALMHAYGVDGTLIARQLVPRSAPSDNHR